jgi:hypothetical protein
MQKPKQTPKPKHACVRTEDAGALLGRQALVALPQVLHELEHRRIAPHPEREAALEAFEGGVERWRSLGRRVGIRVQRERIRPIALDAHRREARLVDEPLGELAAPAWRGMPMQNAQQMTQHACCVSGSKGSAAARARASVRRARAR